MRDFCYHWPARLLCVILLPSFIRYRRCGHNTTILAAARGTCAFRLWPNSNTAVLPSVSEKSEGFRGRDWWLLGFGRWPACLFCTIYGINKQHEQRRREVAAVCRAEIRATWALLNKMTVIQRLQESSRKIRELKNAADKSSLNGLCYRGSPGESWLCLQSSNPEAFGVLPHTLAQQATSHYSRLRNVICRTNWMNSTGFRPDRYAEVLGRQEDTEAELRDSKGETK